MPQSLYQQIKTLKEAQWNYYAGAPNNKSLSVPFITGRQSNLFIKDYFHKGGKDLIADYFNLDSFGKERADHTVSIFFFGLLLFHNTEFKNQIFYDGRFSDRYDLFAYIWFMTCLGHDVAFYSERDEALWEKNPTIEALIEGAQAEHNLLARSVEHVPQDMFNLIRPYFDHRHAAGKTDHGIYAGLLSYDLLVKNRLYHHNDGDSNWTWDEYLDDIYAYCAGTVAVHNMWIPGTQAEIDEYKRHGLQALIGRPRITLKEAPLLYLLGLVDTLDPVKLYHSISPKYVLQNISLSFPSSTSFSITVSPKLDYDRLKERSDEAQKWLDVSIELSERSILVSIKI